MSSPECYANLRSLWFLHQVIRVSEPKGLFLSHTPPASSGQPPLHKQTTGNKRSASEASCANLLIFSLNTSRVGRLDGGDAPLRADAPRRGRCVYPPSGRLSPVGDSLAGGRGGPVPNRIQAKKFFSGPILFIDNIYIILNKFFITNSKGWLS